MTLPFVMPSSDVFFASPRRVFAHRVPLFSLSIGNQPAATDYYNTQFLTVSGENGKHAAYGGFLRSRPLAVTPTPAPANYALVNMEQEVRMAIARGITGFCLDIQGVADALSPTGSLSLMCQAAQAVDPRFEILPMLDMNALVGLSAGTAATIISQAATYPSVSRTWDGRVRFSAYDANLETQVFWTEVINDLNNEGVNVAFIPLLPGEPSSNPFDSISLGFAGWGTAIPSVAQAYPPMYMMPVLTQQFRPSSQVFWESSGSDTFRAGWLQAINSPQCEIVQIVTWNDFAESSQVQPYTDATLANNIGTAFYDLTAYYATWFASGQQPAITQDRIYWFYRKMQSTAAHPNQPDAFRVVSSTETSNIEALAFLTAPGTVLINGVNFPCPAGITSCKAPTAPGNPTFALQRNGSNVFQGVGPVTIYGPEGAPSGVLDLTYFGGSFP